MVDVKDLRSTVVRLLREYTGKQVIVADQDVAAPPKPYTSIKFTTVGERVGGANRYMTSGKRTHEQTFEMTLSVTNIGASIDDATNLAFSALAFFDANFTKLSDERIVVVSTTPLSDRTTVLEIGYEYKVGFDVRLRVHSRTTHTTDLLDKVIFD